MEKLLRGLIGVSSGKSFLFGASFSKVECKEDAEAATKDRFRMMVLLKNLKKKTLGINMSQSHCWDSRPNPSNRIWDFPLSRQCGRLG